MMNLFRMRAALRELSEIRVQLTRIADSLNPSVRAVKPLGKGDPNDAEVTYRDEEMEFIREYAKQTRQYVKGVYDPNEDVPVE